MILRGACYERVSSEEQAKFGFSIETQIDALNEYCEKNDIRVVDHYCDDGVSGGKAAFKRPQMSRLLEDVKNGKVDIILFTRLDRWFRNVKEYFKVQEILDEKGVQWKAIWEDYDTTTSNGRMAITIFLAIAQNEREKTSERIKVVFDHKIKKGEALFNNRSMPYGYTKKVDEDGIPRLVKDPELEDAVQAFWDLAQKYDSVYAAAREVNLVYGLKRSRKNWHDVAKNEIYAGRYRGVLDYCEPYVSYDDWLRFQKRPRYKQSKGDRTYIFTGMIRCPKCGRIMTSKHTKVKRKNGEEYDYKSYKCPVSYEGVCTHSRSIGEPVIERQLLADIEKHMENEIARVELELKKPKKKRKTNVASLREELRRLNVTYRAGNMTDDEYIEESKFINAQIVKAEAEAKDEPPERDLTGLKQMLETDFRSIYATLNDMEKRRFWRGLIDFININENGEIISVDFLY